MNIILWLRDILQGRVVFFQIARIKLVNRRKLILSSDQWSPGVSFFSILKIWVTTFLLFFSTNQFSTEQTGSRAFLRAHDPSAGCTVVDELMLHSLDKQIDRQIGPQDVQLFISLCFTIQKDRQIDPPAGCTVVYQLMLHNLERSTDRSARRMYSCLLAYASQSRQIIRQIQSQDV